MRNGIKGAASLLAAALLVSGCVSSESSTRPESTDAPLFPPASTTRLRTTDGGIFLANLDAQIDALEDRLQQRPSPVLATSLAAQRLLRYRIRARTEDLDRALELVEGAGEDPASRVLRARVLAARHDFEGALRQLQGLSAPGHAPPGARVLERDILRALGRADQAPASARPDLVGLAWEANQYLDRGQLAEAMARFHLAEGAYVGASPYPLAWLHSQIGIGYLRYGRYHSALTFFDAALERLPGLVIALDHRAETLAALGRDEEAITAYRQLVETTGDPEFCGVLAGLLESGGEAEAARPYRRCARQGFATALARHPRAALHHAAEYHLELGEHAQAFELAQRNAAFRADPASRVLLARTALASGHRDLACRQVDELARRGYAPPELEPVTAACATRP